MATFKGFASPNYTQSPNEFYDDLLPKITTLGELKVTEVVIRYTMGFHRHECPAQLDWFMEKTDLSRKAVLEGIREAIKRGTIRRDNKRHVITLRFADNFNENVRRSGVQSTPSRSVQSTPKAVYGVHRKKIQNGVNRPMIKGHFAPVEKR